tara:strand:- start:530 stop:2206 length:1677 start_codon:yes stop_codon:yes gene_type:complete
MALNPFFLQGSQDEQRLIQDLINEQLQIYGVEVTYIPRKFVNKQSIIEEVQSSRFDDNFLIEAYINNYEGYSGAGDVMTKFGVSLRDEVTLTISQERFTDFIAPFLDDADYELGSRPREGDLVYFPLGQRLFEVKFVEHEKPFYMLQKNYVYELQCELFEYEDEIIDTSIDEIDEQVQDEGFITTLNLVGTGRTATAGATLVSAVGGKTGYIRSITLLNDGSGYTSTPTVFISTSRSSNPVNASAVAITTSVGGLNSVKELILTNAGAGYTQPPDINIVGGGGSGAIATCTIEETQKGIISFTITDEGLGYTTQPTITITGPGTGTTAIGDVVVDSSNAKLQAIRIKNPGIGYTQNPTITIGDPNIITGRGNFFLNDLIVGQTSLTEARVKEWDADTKVLKVSNVGIGTTISGFIPGEEIRIQTGIGDTGLKEYKTEHVSRYTRNISIGAGSSVLSVGSGNTSNVNIGDSVGIITGFIGAGVTVHSIGNYGYVYMSIKSLNTSSATKTVSFGSTVFTGYNIREYDDRDIYDEYSDNDEFETAADDIIDFAESNPFGTF